MPTSFANASLVVWSDGRAKTAAGTYVNVADRGYFKAVFTEKKDYAEIKLADFTGKDG